VYSFFLKEFLGANAALGQEGPVDEPPAQQLICYRQGLPMDERLSRIDEELIPLSPRFAVALNAEARLRRSRELSALLREEVFRYFPEQPLPLDPQWSGKTVARGREIQRVTFTSFEGLRVKALYSIPAGLSPGAKLPAVLLADHRKGIPVWGNEQPLEQIQWGDRAVLIVETIDQGSRALERNLRSFSDNDPLHHMKRQAMVAGTTLESMQLYELQRSLDLLRGLPHVDADRVTMFGKAEMGVACMYASLLDGKVQRVIVNSPPPSHRQGPHYLGVLRYTDIPEIATLLTGKLRIYGEAPRAFGSPSLCTSLPDCLRN
jgi:hypothetical protein